MTWNPERDMSCHILIGKSGTVDCKIFGKARILRLTRREPDLPKAEPISSV